MTNRHVNIVGGGLAGLLAAVEAARAGLKVSLFEAAADLGGRARTRDAGGFLLNQGPHALYVEGALKRELDRLGIAHAGGRALGGSRQALIGGRLRALPLSLASIATTSLFGVQEKLAYARIFKTVLEGGDEAGTFAEWLDAQRLTPILRATLEAFARLTSYMNGPDHVSAKTMLDQVRLGFGGTLYLDGGWSSLVTGLEQAARAAGVEIVCAAAVQRLVALTDGAALVLADGSRHPATATILALGPAEAAALAPAAPSLALEAREARPVRANTLDLALSRFPKGGCDFVLGIDQPVYLSLHSVSAKLAPEDGAIVHIAKYLPIGEGPARGTVAELEAVADLAMPGWRDLEVRRQTLQGMPVAQGLPRHDRLRPSVAMADTPGVFIAGDWVGPEGMIADAAAASAIAAARAAIRWIAQAPADRAVA